VWEGDPIETRYVKFTTEADKYSFLMISEVEVWIKETTKADTIDIPKEGTDTKSSNN
jgi:hypothetical protein